MNSYIHYWGKAQPHENAASSWHPLAYHSLDVAAVGIGLLQRQPRLRRHLAAISGLNEHVVLRWAFLSLAFHDLGKFAPAFQAKAPAEFERIFDTSAWIGTSEGHDQDGLILWHERYMPRENILAMFGALGDRRAHHRREAVGAWTGAALCHHGQPREWRGKSLADRFREAHCAAIDAFVAEVIGLAETIGAAATIAPPPQAQTSWFVAGLAVLSDWVGSGQQWFPYFPPDPERKLAGYWLENAQPNAERAISEAGVVAANPAISVRLPDFLPQGAEATPLQQRVADMPICTGPQLFIVEDQTGAGKTEAALALAGRLIADGHADGLFIALPTMATANAMYERCTTLYRYLFAAQTGPSITLAHSRRDLVLALKNIRLGRAQVGKSGDEAYPGGLEPASVACTRWLSDDRRKAALADCGIGTIDQAVLAVLPSRFQSLRLAGLARKVLVVDEVHAHEAYLRRLVCGLLSFHAALGGSAILLSATLPANQKKQFLAAFAEGLGCEPPHAVDENAYPLVMRFGGEGTAVLPVDPRPGLGRDLAIEFLGSAETAIETIVAAAAAGKAVCWIRNTVADAMDAYLELQGRIPAMRLTLFHARFAIGDRLEIERKVLHLFGKDGTAEQRCGQVLIATQVIEQSLDLDFDVMISDLAPIDSLIQRAGRLWRHVHRERVGSPVLHLISPDLAGSVDAAWYRRLFPRGAIVYPDHGALWLTADELARRGTLHLPMEARALIEAVYDEAAAERIPDALEPSRLKYEGGTLSAKIIAESALLPLSEGYTHAVDNFENDMLVPTRLGQPQSQLRLAKWQDGTLRPWAEGDDWIAWRLSELTILKVYVAQEVPAADTVLAGAIAKAHDSWPERDKDSVLIALAREGENTENWIGEALDRNGKPVALRYNDEFGLAVSR